MNSFILKLLAASFMVIDHVGFAFFPGELGFRLIGRLSFPIFAWLIAVGFEHTKSVQGYLKRLFIFGVIAQIPYSILFNTPTLNILFTFFLSVLLLNLIKNGFGTLSRMQSILLIFGAVLASWSVDYSLYGVLLPVVFYLFSDSRVKLFLYNLVMVACFSLYGWFFLGDKSNPFYLLQIFSLLALPLIFSYNGKKGLDLKYAFYAFYPLHLAVLYLLHLII